MTVTEKLDGFFHITERGSSVRTEFKGALLIFLSMAYILAVNPQMMAEAGMDRDAAFTASVLISIMGCLMMGLYANFPVAQAPAMGINAFFVYTVVITMGFEWDTALAAVFISGILFFIVAVSGIRERVLSAIPRGLTLGITAGIGCFIALIGLVNAGIIVSNPSTVVGLGDLADTGVLLALFCIGLTVLLHAGRFRLAILAGMAVTAVVGVAIGVIPLPESLVAVPHMPEVGAFLDGFSPDIFSLEFVMVIVSFLFVEFFDSTGTLMAVGKRAGMVDRDGNVLCDRALVADSSMAAVSGVIGSTPSTAFAESAVGIEAGSRTGLTAVFVAAFFALALLIGPVFQIIDYRCTVAAMVLVGVAMITELKGVDWDDLPLTIGVLFTIMMILLTYSITNGITMGIIMYCIAMVGSRRHREVSPVLYAMAIVSALYFAVTAVGI